MPRPRIHPLNSRDLERDCDLVANHRPNMTSALCNFDQPMQLVVAGARFNLKFYLNFSEMPFFIGARGNRRLADS